MKIKNGIFALLIALSSIHTFADSGQEKVQQTPQVANAADLSSVPANRQFKAREGVVDFAKLETLYSNDLGGKVTINEIRWPHDPMTYFAYVLFAGTRHFYTVKFKINDIYDGQCNLIFIPQSREIYLTHCGSDDVSLRADWSSSWTYEQVLVPGTFKPSL
jgi:hypothetical protein